MNANPVRAGFDTAREQRARQGLQDCALQDPRAFEQLYELMAPQLFGVLLRMLRRRALAEEALQDVFVSIWRNSNQYQPERGSAVAWMLGIARYRAIDLLRQERRGPQAVPDPEALSEASSPPEEPPAAGDALERCLGLLSGEQRRCLQFAFVAGRSHLEISQLTGNPLGTVKSWIRRALFSLRTCLET